MVLNLINNATDILQETKIQHPHIVLKSSSNQTHILISVSDNGGGIPSEIIDDIFTPYFTTREKKGGTGLGLYMSSIIIENCGGELVAENMKQGACFTIKLPLTNQRTT